MKKEQEEQELESKEVYLDSNLFITSVISTATDGEKARAIIKQIKEGEYEGYTSVLTLDEVIWIVQKFKDKETAYETGKTLIGIPNINFVPIGVELISKSLELYKNTLLDPRDAIHLATMQQKGIKTIISQDSDFDKIKNIKRIDFSK
ncbi:MAG: type II toxin-antitoxin system VapC family toxin [Nanoarchaeota archaeon]